MDEKSLSLVGGSELSHTFTVYWANASNPERFILPWDVYLIHIYGTSINISRIFSRDGRTSLPASGLAGVGGGLIALIRGGISSEWHGRSKLNAGEDIWYGGDAVGMQSVLVFEYQNPESRRGR
jgi:hypothetical protein